MLLLELQKLFQSTLPIQGATGHFHQLNAAPIYFNPRSQYRERQLSENHGSQSNLFQSTLPIQGATIIQRWISKSRNDFNPRSQYRERRSYDVSWTDSTDFNPRSQYRERQSIACLMRFVKMISIHAPNTGSDYCKPPRWYGGLVISIHAPNTGSDIRKMIPFIGG